MKGVIHGCLLNDFMVFVIQNDALCTYPIVSSERERRILVKEAIKFDAANWSKISVSAVEDVGDHSELVVCCPKSGVLRYRQDP